MLKSAIINVDRRRGSREREKLFPQLTRTIRLRPACIRARLTFARHKFMQNNSTTTVHYGADSAGSKTLPEPRVLRSSSARVHALLVLLAVALVFWLAISIRLTLRGDPERLTVERLN